RERGRLDVDDLLRRDRGLDDGSGAPGGPRALRPLVPGHARATDLSAPFRVLVPARLPRRAHHGDTDLDHAPGRALSPRVPRAPREALVPRRVPGSGA